jgi:hypothetical protein
MRESKRESMAGWCGDGQGYGGSPDDEARESEAGGLRLSVHPREGLHKSRVVPSFADRMGGMR